MYQCICAAGVYVARHAFVTMLGTVPFVGSNILVCGVVADSPLAHVVSGSLAWVRKTKRPLCSRDILEALLGIVALQASHDELQQGRRQQGHDRALF